MNDNKLSSVQITGMASKPREHSKEGAPTIGLYFTSPLQTEGYKFPIQTGHAFREVNNSPYERNMHVMELHLPNVTNEEFADNASLISEICKNSGIVFIVKSDIEAAKKYKADGIILEDIEESLKNIRNEFDADFIIGFDVKNCKKTAKKLIDNPSLDYVSFEYSGKDTFKLIEFWKNNSPIPCAVTGYITPEICKDLVEHGVDFIGCGDYVWEQENKIAEAVKKLSDSIEKTLTNRTIQ